VRGEKQVHGAATYARTYAQKLGTTSAKTVQAMGLAAVCCALDGSELPPESDTANAGFAEEQNSLCVFKWPSGISPAEYRSRFSTHVQRNEDQRSPPSSN
jgi:transcriptional regulator GlxA family with amidase domain